MTRINKQVRRILLTNLLLFYLVGCGSITESARTLSPVVTKASRPSSIPTALATTPTALPRSEVVTYTVQDGDTASGIAAQFNLKPETVLWANYEQLLDNPDLLFPGMQLTILPVDGVYHQVGGTDTLTSVANFFGADLQAIVDWPGNKLNSSSDVIFVGQWLLVPGGRRALRRRLMPNLPRYAMAVSFEEYGSGACPQNVSAGITGGGIYAWPVTEHKLIGDGYWSAHPAADLAATINEEVYAADDGVVVFSGWSNLLYGNMVMLDHGNGDFTLYGGLAEALALCGNSVAQGEIIGIAGSTGHPVSPYVHFEIRRDEEFIDPLEQLP